MTINAIIMAAGQGTRMRSKWPKVMHPLMGKPMLSYPIDTAHALTDEMPVVVVGYGAEQIQYHFKDQARFVLQEKQLGTGHAVQKAENLLNDRVDQVVILPADLPLLTTSTLGHLVEIQTLHSGPVSLLTIESDSPRGFGRIIRDDHGEIQAIIEEAQATPEQLAIKELNVGVYCIATDWLWEALKRIPLSPKGEYYLTDLIAIAVEDRLSIQSHTLDNPEEAIGINTRVHLAEAERVLRKRINRLCMTSGVTIIDPESTYIEANVRIGKDSIIWPNTFLHGDTIVGEDSVVGPNSIVRDSQIGNSCKVLSSVVEYAILEDEVSIGPFSRLRKGAHLAQGTQLGNFGEVKNSYLGPGTKMGHFSYIGDTTIAGEVNVGAGTITCNYDGVKKHSTEIGRGTFIGSDTLLVAPLKLGEGVYTGAGSVVTKDIPDNTLAVGMPARAIRKLKESD